MKSKDFLNEKWSQKYKKSINCSNPKGFSQRAHCAGRKKNEDVELDEVNTFKQPRQGSLKHQIAQQSKKYRDQQPVIEPKDQQVGTAKVIPKGMAEGKDTTPPGSPAWKDGYRAGMKDTANTKPVGSYAYKQGWQAAKKKKQQGVAEGKDDLSRYSTERLQAYVKKVSGGGVPAFGSGAKLKRVQAELKRRESVMTESDAELAEPPERPRKSQTTTKTKPDIKFDIPFQQAQDHPVAKADPLDDLKRNAGVHDKTKVNLRKASQADTLSKTAGIGSPEMGDMLSRMRNIEIDPDLDAYPDPEPPETLPSVEVNTANLPAVAGQALQAAGVQNPEFHQVANLPGNMADQIRQLGKSLFGALTMTPTKRIYVVANLGGQGPNTNQEVQAVAGFLKEHGDDRGPGDIDFDRVMPGYKAQTHMYSAAGIRWMLVKDFAGQYIYCWPEADSHDATDAIGHDTDTKRLK